MDPHSTSNVNDAKIIDLPRIQSHSGSMTKLVNGSEGMPFLVRRVYYLFDVPADAERGGHSHYEARSILVALTGSFDVVLDDGINPPRRFTLNRPYRALYVPTGLWRTIDNFSGAAICLSLSSECFSEADYVRDYDRFKQLTAKKQWKKNL